MTCPIVYPVYISWPHDCVSTKWRKVYKFSCKDHRTFSEPRRKRVRYSKKPTKQLKQEKWAEVIKYLPSLSSRKRSDITHISDVRRLFTDLEEKSASQSSVMLLTFQAKTLRANVRPDSFWGKIVPSVWPGLPIGWCSICLKRQT